MNRLTQVDVDVPGLEDEHYTYDLVGNRTTASNATGTIEHNTNNELKVYGDLTYDYDANGNLTEITLDTQRLFLYTYNVDNRLVNVENGVGAVIAEYGYDPFGRRLWKDVAGTRTYFFYSDEGLVAEYDAQGNELRSYGYRPDSTWTTNPLFLKQDGEYYFYHNDHLGTPQKLVKQNGAMVWSAKYTAFGQARVGMETVTNNLRFPGQYYDAETGLHYNWHRYYDPVTGRYTQVDPIGFAGGDVNLYAYVGNNAITRSDPHGLVAPVAAVAAFCFANPEACAAIAYGIGMGVCTAAGWCQPFPLDALLPPSLPPTDIPSFDTPYPDLRPPSLVFPRLPSLPETCDPFPLQYPFPLLDPFPMHKDDPLLDSLLASRDEKIAQHALDHHDHTHFQGKTLQQILDIIADVRENGERIETPNGRVLTRLGKIVLIDDPYNFTSGGTVFMPDNVAAFIRKFQRINR